jgi:hypothetical protein
MFIVLADNMRTAINAAWEHGGADFQSRYDKSTAQAEQMKEGRCAFWIIEIQRSRRQRDGGGNARQPTPNASFQARIIGGDAAGKYSRFA